MQGVGPRIVLMVVFVFACGDDDDEASTEFPSEPGTGTSVAPNSDDGEQAARQRVVPLEHTGFDLVPRYPLRERVTSVAFHPERAHVAAAADARGNVAVFRVPSGEVIAARRLFLRRILHVELAGERLLVLADEEEGGEGADAVAVWNLKTDEVWSSLGAELEATLSPDGRRVVVLDNLDGDAAYDEDYGDEYAEDLDGEYADDEEDDLDGEYADDLDEDDDLREAEEGDEQTELLLVDLDTRERATRTLPYYAVPDRVVFAEDGSLHVVAVSTSTRFSADLEPTEVDFGSSVHVRDIRGEEALVSASDHASIVSLRTGRERVRIEGPGARSFLRDGRVLRCHEGTLHLHGGDDFTTVETVDAPLGDCNGRFAFRVGHLEQWGPRNRGTAYQRATEETDSPSASSAIEPWELRAYPTDLYVPPRGSYFLIGGADGVAIAAPEHQRVRPLVHSGSGELSLWSVRREGQAARLLGGDWEERLGDATADDPRLPRPDERHLVGVSEDAARRVAVVGEHLVLRTAERDLPLVRNVFASEVCHTEGDASRCNVGVRFLEGRVLIVIGSRELRAFTDEGNALGRLEATTWWADGASVVAMRDGSVVLFDSALREKAVLFETPFLGIYPAFEGERVAIADGTTLLVFDGGTRTQSITLPARPSSLFLRGGEVGATVGLAVVRYDVESGELRGRDELRGILVSSQSRGEALYCDGTKLRIRRAEGATEEIAPCPAGRSYGFDSDFVWWVEGTRGHFVRRRDLQHLVVGRLALPRAPTTFAFTPRGHLQLTRTTTTRAFRLRLPGPMLDATLVEADTSKLTPDLVQRFFAGEPLGDAPTWNEEVE